MRLQETTKRHRWLQVFEADKRGLQTYNAPRYTIFDTVHAREMSEKSKGTKWKDAFFFEIETR